MSLFSLSSDRLELVSSGASRPVGMKLDGGGVDGLTASLRLMTVTSASESLRDGVDNWAELFEIYEVLCLFMQAVVHLACKVLLSQLPGKKLSRVWL